MVSPPASTMPHCSDNSRKRREKANSHSLSRGGGRVNARVKNSGSAPMAAKSLSAGKKARCATCSAVALSGKCRPETAVSIDMAIGAGSCQIRQSSPCPSCRPAFCTAQPPKHSLINSNSFMAASFALAGRKDKRAELTAIERQAIEARSGAGSGAWHPWALSGFTTGGRLQQWPGQHRTWRSSVGIH